MKEDPKTQNFKVFPVNLFDMKKPSAYPLLVFLLSLLLFAACDDKPTTDKPVDDNPALEDTVVQEPIKRTGAITPKDSILSKLQAYYADLGNKSDDIGKYFSPTVSRYYSRENISRAEVQKSITGTYKDYDTRNVTVSPSSIKLLEEDDGWWADFKGEVVFQKKGQAQASSDEFHNLFRFDQDYLIDEYGAYSEDRDPAAAFSTKEIDETPSVKAANPNLNSTISGLVKALANGDLAKVDSYVMPEHGLFLALRPGAFDAVYHGTNYSEVIEYMPYFKEGIKGFGCNPKESDFPRFSCDSDDMFSEEGCFLAPIKGYKRISDLMANLNSYEVTDFSVSEIAKARKMEKAASMQLLHTREGLHVVLGQNDAGAWKLLVLDFSKFNCGA